MMRKLFARTFVIPAVTTPAVLVTIVLVLTAVVTPNAAAAKSPASALMYNSVISPLPGNLPSVGVEAYAFDELGTEVTFGPGSTTLSQVVVTLSSWACQYGNWYADTCVTTPGATFALPITFNIYQPPAPGGDTPGSLIGSVTQTFNIPYRPSDNDVKCPPTDGSGRWYSASSKTCFHGLANNIVFDFSSLNLTLPPTIVFGIAYNTENYGYSPYGPAACDSPTYNNNADCPYDSLNIALSQNTNITAGSDAPPLGTVFQNAVYGNEYCDNGLAGVGAFRLDSPTSACWSLGSPGTSPAYIPAVQFKHQ